MKIYQYSLTELRLFFIKSRIVGLFLISIGAMSLLLTQQAHANSQASKVYLARADQLIQSALVMVEKAKAANIDQSTGNTIFHYSWLEGDLADIRKGIQSYINDREILPQSIHVLHKQYQCEGASDVITR